MTSAGTNLPVLPALMVEDAVRAALLEDWGRAGDITAQATLSAEIGARAVIAARRPGRLSGLDLAATAFRLSDPAIGIETLARDGDREARAAVRGPDDDDARVPVEHGNFAVSVFHVMRRRCEHQTAAVAGQCERMHAGSNCHTQADDCHVDSFHHADRLFALAGFALFFHAYLDR